MYGYKRGPPHAYTQYGVGMPKVARQPTGSVSSQSQLAITSQSQMGLANVSMNTTMMSTTSRAEEETWPPNDHFIFALLVTIFCCLPLGGLSLWFVFQGREQKHSNQRKKAITSSRRALRLSVAGLAVGCAITVLAVGIIAARASMMCDKTGWVCVERAFGSDN